MNEIKTKYRFHSELFNKDVFKDYCTHLNKKYKKYKKGDKFYRARYSTELGRKEDEIGSPPISKATAGRVNPKGISILYLGDSVDTSLKEIRAGLYDYVSVGTFVLLKDLIYC